jgi:hypothetical protein
MESHVLAYLDPGSGSLILQVLAGGVAAVAVSFKVFWRRITSFFRRGDEKAVETTDSPS